MQYIRFTVTSTSDFSELVANELFELGGLGVEIVDPNDLKEHIKHNTYWDYIDESAFSSDPRTYVTGFFNENSNISVIVESIGRLKNNAYFETGSLEVKFSLEDTQDYENIWKQYYQPIPLGGITIVPKWLKFTPDNTTPIYLDPGPAFGTGSHETTSMCITLMQNEIIPTQPNYVIDMGCGSGILGITALVLGAKHATMVDIDPIATQAAKDNATLNGVEKSATFITGGFAESVACIKEPADILLANLTVDLLLALHPYIHTILKKDGIMVASGILKEAEPRFMAIYNKDFMVTKTESQNDWCAVVLRKK